MPFSNLQIQFNIQCAYCKGTGQRIEHVNASDIPYPKQSIEQGLFLLTTIPLKINCYCVLFTYIIFSRMEH